MWMRSATCEMREWRGFGAEVSGAIGPGAVGVAHGEGDGGGAGAKLHTGDRHFAGRLGDVFKAHRSRRTQGLELRSGRTDIVGDVIIDAIVNARGGRVMQSIHDVVRERDAAGSIVQ